MSGGVTRKSGIRRYGWGGREDQGMVKGTIRENERKEKCEEESGRGSIWVRKGDGGVV